MGYISINYLENSFGNQYTFGTSGTNIMTIPQGTLNIERASKLIDFKLQNTYGTFTPLFGTNTLGTLDVPNIVMDICADLTMGIVLENRALYITQQQADWGTMIYNRAMMNLQDLIDGKAIAVPFGGTLSQGNLPMASGVRVEIVGETVTFSGTQFETLYGRKVLPGSVKVYGTADINPPSYVEGLDYNVLYFGGTNVGTLYGQIRCHGTGTLQTTNTVRVDYAYEPSAIFRINDYLKWGEGSEEFRG